jgi:serine/threonine-protein kinase
MTVPPVDADATRPPSSQRGWLSSSDSISHGQFAPGAILDGRYRIIGLLGRGGMGEVYRADDLRLGQPVALKFLPDAVSADPVRLAQFHNEVRTARQVSHPNICRVYDIGDINGRLFLSMELVDGEDLATSLRRIGRFPEDKATDIARQLCAGLAAAHQRGVIHRDLKPANVMLDDAGSVRLMDFGLAGIGTVEDVRAGTPAYMAPEQLLGKDASARSDIYALGLVLFELYTGHRAFPANTLNELIQQHQDGHVPRPSTVVTNLDPAVEHAILRCLESDPDRRPASALAVAALLPGGDPLAAALAAGQTPSPAMVAAAGEGAGLTRRTAIAVFIAVLIGIIAVYAVGVRSDPLQVLRPTFSADVLAQKARDTLQALGYTDRARDEAFGFAWDVARLDYRDGEAKSPHWSALVAERPSPLLFWYRRSADTLVPQTFSHDLLTPGIVRRDDPPPILSGMAEVVLDHQGLLTRFEAIPPEVEPEETAHTTAVDWAELLNLAGIDQATLQSTAPHWNWLAAPDTRVAWTGTWPGTSRALRVEAAAHRGRPVAFHAIGPWTRPSRTPEPADTGQSIFLAILLGLILSLFVFGAALAVRNLRDGRGDRRGATSLALAVTAALWLLWLCQVHVTASFALATALMIAVVTTVFYGVLFWGLYLALEPVVRRLWPQTLVSWTTLLSGRARDAVVGRDALFGVALGVSIALIVRIGNLYQATPTWADSDVLLGGRAVAAFALMQLIWAVRAAMLFFLLLFGLRVLLRRQFLAAIAFVSIFAMTNGLGGDDPWFESAIAFVYFSMIAAAVLRWGLTALATAMLVANLLLNVPASDDFSAWYASSALVVTLIPIALAAWAAYVSLRHRPQFR